MYNDTFYFSHYLNFKQSQIIIALLFANWIFLFEFLSVHYYPLGFASSSFLSIYIYYVFPTQLGDK